MIVQARSLRRLVDRIGRAYHPRLNRLIMLRVKPFDDLCIREVYALLGIETQSVAADAVCCRGGHPEGSDGLPIQLDNRDSCWRDDRIEGWQGVEEGIVDNSDSLEKLVVGLADHGTSHEHVIDLRYNSGTGLDCEFIHGLEVEGVADVRERSEGLKASRVSDRVRVVEQNYGAYVVDVRTTRNRNHRRDDM